MIERAEQDDELTPGPDSEQREPAAASGGDRPLPVADEGPPEVVERPLAARVEALLFASGQALTPARLARALSVPVADVHAALEELGQRWGTREGAIELVEIAGGYRFLTRPEYHDDVTGLRSRAAPDQLSAAPL